MILNFCYYIMNKNDKQYFRPVCFVIYFINVRFFHILSYRFIHISQRRQILHEHAKRGSVCLLSTAE